MGWGLVLGESLKCLLPHASSVLFPGPPDLFHWACLNERAAQLPRNTAPAGYQCPSCSGPIFPPSNLVGPVASVLREKLTTVNWARAGLGLPLVRVPLSVCPSVLGQVSEWGQH